MATDDDESPEQSIANSLNGSEDSLHENTDLAPSRAGHRTWSNPEHFKISRIEERSRSAENLSNDDINPFSRGDSYQNNLANSTSDVSHKHPLEISHDNLEDQVEQNSPTDDKTLQEQTRPDSPTKERTLLKQTRPDSPTEGKTLQKQIRPDSLTKEKTLQKQTRPDSPTKDKTLQKQIRSDSPTKEKTLQKQTRSNSPSKGKTLQKQTRPDSPTKEETLQQQTRPDSQVDATSTTSNQSLDKVLQNNMEDTSSVEDSQQTEQHIVQHKIEHDSIQKSNESINTNDDDCEEIWTEMKEISKNQADDADLPEIHFPIPIEEVNTLRILFISV